MWDLFAGGWRCYNILTRSITEAPPPGTSISHPWAAVVVPIALCCHTSRTSKETELLLLVLPELLPMPRRAKQSAVQVMFVALAPLLSISKTWLLFCSGRPRMSMLPAGEGEGEGEVAVRQWPPVVAVICPEELLYSKDCAVFPATQGAVLSKPPPSYWTHSPLPLCAPLSGRTVRKVLSLTLYCHCSFGNGDAVVPWQPFATILQGAAGQVQAS